MSLLVWFPKEFYNNYGLNLNIKVASLTDGYIDKYDGFLTRQCAKFEGTNHTKGVTLSTNPISGLAECSIAFWYYIIDNNIASTPIVFENNVYWQIVMYNNTIYLRDSVTYSTGTRLTLSVNISRATWTHVNIIYDHGILYAYINGILLGSVGTYSETSHLNTLNYAYIGCDPRNTTFVYVGNCYMLDFRIYDHALSPKEIHDLSLGLCMHFTYADQYIENSENLLSDGTLSTKEWGVFSGLTINLSCSLDPNRHLTKITSASSYTSSSVLIGSFRYFMPLAKLQAATTLTISFKCRVLKGQFDPSIVDWCNELSSSSAVIATIEDKGNYLYCQYLVKRSSYDSTYRFLDFNSIGLNTIIEIWDEQLETNDHATPYIKLGSSRQDLYLKDCTTFNYGIPFGTFKTVKESGRYNYSTLVKKGNYHYIAYSSISPNVKTISFWIYTIGFPTQATKIYLDPINKTGVGFYNNGTTIIIGSTSGSKPVFMLQEYYRPGQWNHICVIDNNPNYAVYVNGNLCSQTGAHNYWTWAENYVSIGYQTNGSVDDSFKISDFKLFATELSEADIKDLASTALFINKDQTTFTYTYDDSKLNNTNMLAIESDIISEGSTRGNAAGQRRTLDAYNFQSNCQVSFENGYWKYYRPANITYDGTSATRTMWGGPMIRNTDNILNLLVDHTYLLLFDVKGKSSYVPMFKWTNNAGWDGGGLTPRPNNIIYNSGKLLAGVVLEDWTLIYYLFHIPATDSIYKTCTTSYSSFVAGETYVSYRDLLWYRGYENTGTLGTELYIKNLRMYDITDGVEVDLAKTGVLHITDINETSNSTTTIENHGRLTSPMMYEI